MEFVILETCQLSVEQSILEVFVSEHLHDMQDIFGFSVFHGGFPVSKRVDVDFEDAVVFQFSCDFSSLRSEVSCKVSLESRRMA